MLIRRPGLLAATTSVSAVAWTVDTDVASWAAQVVTGGGTVSAERQALLSAFVRSDKAAGLWAKRDDCWMLAGENSIQARTSLKQRRLATITGSPVFTADRGFLQDGVASYLNTGFIPGTHASNLTAADSRIECYEITNLALSSSYAAGCQNSSTQSCYVNPCTAALRAGVGLSNNGSAAAGQVFLPEPVDSRGLVGGQRVNSSTTLDYDKNGVAFGSVSPTFSSVIPSVALYIGALNNNGTAASFRPTAISWLSVGGSLTSAQLAAGYAAVQGYMATLGASV